MYNESGQGNIKTIVNDVKVDAPAANLWAVYVAEAERYDKGLVESWKSDMEGMLIFAGLFSASLTAFLIESYRSLTPDPGDVTVALLQQISHQLAASANGTRYDIPTPPAFTPTTTSIVCNVLWFLSLGLSLGCALIATLVEQWARDFLHRANMHSAPVVRARVFSYLYYGLRRFEMHTMVEVIPLFLHASLVFFFAGLVAFLIPVNTAITAVAAALLGIILIVYSLFTILALIYLDCPYRTPLSATLWNLKQHLMRQLHQQYPASPDEAQKAFDKGDSTMVECMLDQATESSPERAHRDERALIWTLKSLADDTELEPFVEAIPDVLCGPQGRWHYVYEDHIRSLIKDPDTKLLGRIRELYESCFSGILTPELTKRRKISCYKATWAIGSLATPGTFTEYLIDSSPDFQAQEDVEYYRISAAAMGHWADYVNIQGKIEETLKHLTIYQSDLITGHSPHVFHLPQYLKHWAFRSGHMNYTLMHLQTRGHDTPNFLLSDINNAIEEISALPVVVPFSIFLDFLLASAGRKSPPYEFNTTLSIISGSLPTYMPLSRSLLRKLEYRLEIIVYEYMDRFKREENYHWLDSIVVTMCHYFYPADDEDPSVRLPSALIAYLNQRQSLNSVRLVITSLPIILWNVVAQTILNGPSQVRRDPPPIDCVGGPSPLMISLWHMYHKQSYIDVKSYTEVKLSTWQAVLDAILKSESGSDLSVVAMAKWAAWTFPIAGEQEFRFMSTRMVEAGNTDSMFRVLTEYIENCCQPGELPFKAVETIATIGNFHALVAPHPAVQMSFATSVKNLFGKFCQGEEDSDFLDRFIRMPLFNTYDPGVVWWLDDIPSRIILKDALSNYSPTVADLPMDMKFGNLKHNDRLQEFLASLEKEPQSINKQN